MEALELYFKSINEYEKKCSFYLYFPCVIKWFHNEPKLESCWGKQSWEMQKKTLCELFSHTH